MSKEKAKRVIRSRYDERNRVSLKFDLPSLTKQSDAKDCDINNIVNTFRKTGQLPPVVKQGQYADVSEIGSYQDAMNFVLNVQDTFDALPSKVRNKFRNNPAEFVDFVQDERNTDELRELGLLIEESETKKAKASKAQDEPVTEPKGDKIADPKGSGTVTS